MKMWNMRSVGLQEETGAGWRPFMEEQLENVEYCLFNKVHSLLINKTQFNKHLVSTATNKHVWCCVCARV